MESHSAKSIVGPVTLIVADLPRARRFYTSILGLSELSSSGGRVALGAGDLELLILEERLGATRPAFATGLFHFAILVPSRFDLSRWLRHFIETKTPLSGMADHLVSEAIYLADPEGNGIEIYRDRPRAEWPRKNGQIVMASDPLDLEGLMDEAANDHSQWKGLPAGTVLGHMHLKVSDLPAAEKFYREVVGLDLMLHFGRSAAFMSTGGYHHHLGLNTWESNGAPAPKIGAAGLKEFVLRASKQVIDRAIASGTAKVDGNQVRIADPSGNIVVMHESRNPIF